MLRDGCGLWCQGRSNEDVALTMALKERMVWLKHGERQNLKQSQRWRWVLTGKDGEKGCRQIVETYKGQCEEFGLHPANTMGKNVR